MSERLRKHVPAGGFLLVGAALLACARLSPDRYKLWLQEDGPIEWWTVWAFVAAAVLFIRWALRGQGLTRHRALIALVGAFCLFVAGEELSWGERLFSIQPPELLLEENFQQELNFHNLLKDIFDSRWQVFCIAIGYGVLGPWLGRTKWLSSELAPRADIMPVAIGVALLELSYPAPLSGEVAELLLGFCFLYDAILRTTSLESARPRRALIGLATTGIVAACTPPMLDATLLRVDPTAVATAQSELSSFEEHLKEGGARRMLFGRSRIHKRIHTAVKVGYLTAPGGGEATALGSDEEATRKRYFLDPWQQPYWIAFQARTKKSGTAVVYSFGPNRRRDTLMDRLPRDTSWSPEGDDIAVVVEVSR